MIYCDFLVEFTTLKGANFKQHTSRKNSLNRIILRKLYLSHCPAQPLPRDMRTSGNKMNINIENINFQTIPEKDTIHTGRNEYFNHPFRTNKQGKRSREPASLIKE
ncbi:MAG: hypothetical protein ISS76_11930 [Phycisphaerae bacterium]|nr:hypothetical protein [Phycisphaerae bacterium]